MSKIYIYEAIVEHICDFQPKYTDWEFLIPSHACEHSSDFARLFLTVGSIFFCKAGLKLNENICNAPNFKFENS